MCFGQVIMPATPTPALFHEIITEAGPHLPALPSPSNALQPMTIQFSVYEQDRRRVEQQEMEMQEIYADMIGLQISYDLPDKGDLDGRGYYLKAYEALDRMEKEDFSVKDATFIIENAFFEGEQKSEEFEKIIKQTGDFLREKMSDFNYDKNSNLAKNFILFQFFADTLEIESKDLRHLPFKYDFDDYMGIKDWSNMFVSKLLETGKGQCNSLPRLYLILAEEIGAEAFLSLSPNHSYIKFRDKEDKWYNVELTNGMFTTDSSILQSGFIKSEALQHGIYMQTMTDEQLFSQLLADFAQGYARKYGYEPFVKNVVDRALEIYPENINANMLNSNYLTQQFEYVMKQLNIDPHNAKDLQNIRYFPKAVALLDKVNAQYDKIDDLGFEFMAPEAYQKWLSSLQETKQQQEDREMKEQFNIQLQPKIKN